MNASALPAMPAPRWRLLRLAAIAAVTLGAVLLLAALAWPAALPAWAAAGTVRNAGSALLLSGALLAVLHLALRAPPPVAADDSGESALFGRDSTDFVPQRDPRRPR